MYNNVRWNNTSIYYIVLLHQQQAKEGQSEL